MLAMTEMPCRDAQDRFASTLRTFHEHARAIAGGNAQDDAFNWFLATECQREMEMACEWLVESPASRLPDADKATLRHFLGSLPAVRQAIVAGRQEASDRTSQVASPEWADWLAIAALPSWNDFTVRTAILLSQLGTPARNDDRFAA
ncbi:MAG: hypothetical protein KGJ32_14425 [Xanthomonadaceae bacterium]|nr:hypothetical protein [Xanthomonadaceae bacterium]